MTSPAHQITISRITASQITAVRDRCLPVEEVFASMLPEGGLVRGRVVGCTGPAAMTLGLALVARSVASGSWLALVGMPMFGVEAADEIGVPLSRLVRVDDDGGPSGWAERIAAAADGFEVIMTRPPPGAERTIRKVRQRIQARGAVLLAVGPSSPGVSCDLELGTSAATWVGLGAGWGHLRGRRVMVRVGGRRVPRAVERELWLPGPDGRVVAVHGANSARPTSDEGEVVDVELGRAG